MYESARTAVNNITDAETELNTLISCLTTELLSTQTDGILDVETLKNQLSFNPNFSTIKTNLEDIINKMEAIETGANTTPSGTWTEEDSSDDTDDTNQGTPSTWKPGVAQRGADL